MIKITQKIPGLEIVLIICCIFFCGCDKNIPINERPMYGNVPPTPKVERANEDFIKTIEARGSREDGSQKMVEAAWYYYGKNNLAVAMKRFNQAWLLNSNNPEIYLGFACIAAKKNNFNESIDMNSIAIRLNSNYAAAYSNRGIDYFRRGDKGNDMNDIKKSVDDFTKAIEIEPGYAQNYNDRAASYATLGEYDKSLNDLQKAQELGYKVSREFIQRVKTHTNK